MVLSIAYWLVAFQPAGFVQTAVPSQSIATPRPHIPQVVCACVVTPSAPYFFFASGGKCSNILFTPLSRFLMFVSDLLERVPLDDPRQIRVLVLASSRSTTKVPTL